MIQNITAEDSGSYSCNALGDPGQHIFLVEVRVNSTLSGMLTKNSIRNKEPKSRKKKDLEGQEKRWDRTTEEKPPPPADYDFFALSRSTLGLDLP